MCIGLHVTHLASWHVAQIFVKHLHNSFSSWMGLERLFYSDIQSSDFAQYQCDPETPGHQYQIGTSLVLMLDCA